MLRNAAALSIRAKRFRSGRLQFLHPCCSAIELRETGTVLILCSRKPLFVMNTFRERTTLLNTPHLRSLRLNSLYACSARRWWAITAAEICHLPPWKERTSPHAGSPALPAIVTAPCATPSAPVFPKNQSYAHRTGYRRRPDRFGSPQAYDANSSNSSNHLDE